MYEALEGLLLQLDSIHETISPAASRDSELSIDISTGPYKQKEIEIKIEEENCIIRKVMADLGVTDLIVQYCIIQFICFLE